MTPIKKSKKNPTMKMNLYMKFGDVLPYKGVLFFFLKEPDKCLTTLNLYYIKVPMHLFILMCKCKEI